MSRFGTRKLTTSIHSPVSSSACSMPLPSAASLCSPEGTPSTTRLVVQVEEVPGRGGGGNSTP